MAGEYFTIDDVFSFLIVRNSGHLLPMDIPATALEMLRRFLFHLSFASIPLPSEISYIQELEKGSNLSPLSGNESPSSRESGIISSSNNIAGKRVSFIVSGVWLFTVVAALIGIMIGSVAAFCKFTQTPSSIPMMVFGGRKGYQSLSNEGDREDEEEKTNNIRNNCNNVFHEFSDEEGDGQTKVIIPGIALKEENFIGLHAQPPSLSGRPPRRPSRVDK